MVDKILISIYLQYLSGGKYLDINISSILPKILLANEECNKGWDVCYVIVHGTYKSYIDCSRGSVWAPPR